MLGGLLLSCASFIQHHRASRRGACVSAHEYFQNVLAHYGVPGVAV